MNINEDYFRISKNGNIHTLSDRIPFKWKEIFIWILPLFLFSIAFFNWYIAFYIGILSLIGYIFFRLASWMYYSEVIIDEKSKEMFKQKKILNKIIFEELITNNIDILRFYFTEIKRSGTLKFLISYNTHKTFDLLILKNHKDKEFIENYILKEIKIS